MNKPDKNDFDEWKENPVTQWFFSEVEKAINEATERMGYGGTLDTRSSDRTAMVTAGMVGFLDGLKEVFNIEVKE